MDDIKNSDKREEREISITKNNLDDSWTAWTNDPVQDRKLRKVGAEVTKEYKATNGDVMAREYRLEKSMVSLRKKPKPRTYTKVQREAAAARMRNMNKTRLNGL